MWKLWDHPFWELARATWITVKFIVEKYDDKNFLIDDVDGVDEQAVQGGAGGQGGQVALQEQCKSSQVHLQVGQGPQRDEVSKHAIINFNYREIAEPLNHFRVTQNEAN